jgi:hypothetical protein
MQWLGVELAVFQGGVMVEACQSWVEMAPRCEGEGEQYVLVHSNGPCWLAVSRRERASLPQQHAAGHAGRIACAQRGTLEGGLL